MADAYTLKKKRFQKLFQKDELMILKKERFHDDVTIFIRKPVDSEMRISLVYRRCCFNLSHHLLPSEPSIILHVNYSTCSTTTVYSYMFCVLSGPGIVRNQRQGLSCNQRKFYENCSALHPKESFSTCIV